MAEARTEEEEENVRRENREQVVRRQPGGRADRRKPEHRHSQGPLSSIRAAIKRTSTRPTSASESGRERERDRERRRPEITILSAEPLASTSWFPGASGGFPPPPPPAAQIWGATIPPTIQPPPSYEEVIREKTQEQVILPSSSHSSSSLSHPAPTITIATQTDAGAQPGPPESPGRRPVRPPRPTLACPSRRSHVDNVTPDQPPQPRPETLSTYTPCCDLLGDLCTPSTSVGAQTERWDHRPVEEAPCSPADSIPPERPRPRPRSKFGLRSTGSEVRVQTLVKLREDGLVTLAAAEAARAGSDTTNRHSGQGRYLQELLEAFSSDDWGFPEQRSDSSGVSQSESEEEDDDMATLRARIQAFEEQAEGTCGVAENLTNPSTKPAPRPRPRLQGQPAKSVPPVIAPKPKNLPSTAKPSSKGFWEDGAVDTTESFPTGSQQKTETCPDPQVPGLETPKAGVKPPVTPKPQFILETPVPAPRPPQPKLLTSGSDSASNPKPPPRPSVTPRTSVVASPQDRSSTGGHSTPTLPPRPCMEVCGTLQAVRTGSEETQSVTAGSVRPDVPTKPAAPNAPRRASAPHVAPKLSGVSSTPPEDSHQGSPRPPGPARPPNPSPAPASKKGPVTHSGAPNTGNQLDPGPPAGSSVKLLPLRPPPIKSNPGRPPPPAFSSAPTTNQTSPQFKPADTLPVTQVFPPQSSPSIVTANQKAPKRGPPLPPRPKPGHPLYSSYMKQEVLIVLDDPSPAPSEDIPVEEGCQTAVINPSESRLDLDTQQDLVNDLDGQSKAALESLGPTDSESILPLRPVEQKEQPDTPPASGPRCVATFDYEGEEDDELTFSQGDVIALLELVDQDWGRGQIHGRVGIFPLNFTEVVEALHQVKMDPTITAAPQTTPLLGSEAPTGSEAEEWDTALFDFPGQTAEDLSFQRGALIQVTERVDAKWRRGRLDGREGLYPVAFTEPYQAQPIRSPRAEGHASGTAEFDFTAENDDELSLKVGDIITQVEPVDEQWILGVVGGKRGIVPRNYVSLF